MKREDEMEMRIRERARKGFREEHPNQTLGEFADEIIGKEPALRNHPDREVTRQFVMWVIRSEDWRMKLEYLQPAWDFNPDFTIGEAYDWLNENLPVQENKMPC